MNALPMERLIPAPGDAADHSQPAIGRQALIAKQGTWPLFSILTAFWLYVTLSNVFYAITMQSVLTTLQMHNVYAPWNARVLQHVFLYPVFLGCVWASLRIGWQPLWRTASLQLLCALGFSILASPALMLGEKLIGDSIWEEWHTDSWHSALAGFVAGPAIARWLASVTNFLLTYGFGLALVAGFDFYRRLRDAQLRSAALERSLNSAHLTALRMQLSPHTLFNLLHTIRGQIGWDPAAAQSMIVQLGDLLRRLLRAGERELSRLSDELQFVRLYLDLQQKRFSDRLTVRVPAQDTLPQVWVPSLILQPLVENAVVHALAGHEAAVEIRVEAFVSDEILCLRVINSLSPEKQANPIGIGLRNVRERLTIQFGERATFNAAPGEDNDWIAEICMPLLRDGP
jgi:two-component system, LytTR family, sensor kinase